MPQPDPMLAEIVAQLQAQLADKDQQLARKDQALALAEVKIDDDSALRRTRQGFAPPHTEHAPLTEPTQRTEAIYASKKEN